MLKITEYSVHGFEEAIRGMRNPMNSWDLSDSGTCKGSHFDDCKIMAANGCPRYDDDFSFDLYCVGENDYKLMQNLVKAGKDHRKFMRMITVYVDITAPLYWWKEFDTYKVGTVANSCSTMHKIHANRFERSDFSIEHLQNCEEQHWLVAMDNVISALNTAREQFLKTNDKKYWWQMIQLLPSSYNQKRTVMMNYEVLANIYQARKNHKLDEWHTLCDWINALPYSELITGKEG